LTAHLYDRVCDFACALERRVGKQNPNGIPTVPSHLIGAPNASGDGGDDTIHDDVGIGRRDVKQNQGKLDSVSIRSRTFAPEYFVELFQAADSPAATYMAGFHPATQESLDSSSFLHGTRSF
jgi:hypothetical protein